MNLRLPLTHPLHLVMGFIIWSLWFAGVYGGLSLACLIEHPPDTLGPRTWINAVLLVATLLTAALLALLAFRCWRRSAPAGEHQRQHKFTLRVAAAVYLAGAVATLAVGLPIIVLPPCL